MTLAKRTISCKCRCAFDGRTCNSRQKWNSDKCYFECKKRIKNCTCEKDFTQNPSTCECMCNKYCMIGEYLQGCESMKSLIDDLLVPYDVIADTQESAQINPSDGINYDLIAVVLISLAGLLLFVVIVA